MVRNVSSVGSDMEYVAVFIRDTKGVPKKAAFSDSGLRRDFLATYSIGSLSLLCVYTNTACMLLSLCRYQHSCGQERFEC